tara:strand:+ start:39 stop:212 length:174 start_codon:yes stop_codon:yes gene_type:complete
MVNEELKPLTEDEIRLECLKLSVEFGPEVQRQNPLLIAEKYYSWVKKIHKRKSKQTS